LNIQIDTYLGIYEIVVIVTLNHRRVHI